MILATILLTVSRFWFWGLKVIVADFAPVVVAIRFYSFPRRPFRRPQTVRFSFRLDSIHPTAFLEHAEAEIAAPTEGSQHSAVVGSEFRLL
jgi:hypothetical protein